MRSWPPLTCPHLLFFTGHIKGIYNYMDVGVELRKRLSTQDPPSLMVGSAWQVRLQVLSVPTAIPQLFTSTSHPAAFPWPLDR